MARIIATMGVLSLLLSACGAAPTHTDALQRLEHRGEVLAAWDEADGHYVVVHEQNAVVKYRLFHDDGVRCTPVARVDLGVGACWAGETEVPCRLLAHDPVFRDHVPPDALDRS